MDKFLGVRILSNVDDVIGHLTDLEYKHLTFVMMKTLNSVATEARDEIRREMPDKFTLRRNWSQRGVRVEFATKKRLRARIYTVDYLMQYMEEGGTRSAKGQGDIWVPTLHARKGEAFEGALKPGMRPKSIRKKLMAKTKRRKKPGRGKHKKPKPFILDMGGGKKMVMIRENADKRLPIVPLYVLARQARYYARWGFGETANKIVAKRFRPEFFRFFEHALATSRTGPKKSAYLSYMAEHGGNETVSQAMSKVSTGLPSYSGVMG